MRIAIFGATGAVGSTLIVHLFKSADLQLGDELVLVGRGTGASMTKLLAMQADLLDAFDAGVVKIEICSSLDALEGVDVFVMAAGATVDKNIKNRSELAEKNAPFFHSSASRLSQRCPKAFVLIVSNPVELAVGIFARYMDRALVAGMGAQQDSLRFARAIAVHLQIPRTTVRASVVGEHGDGMVPLWSSVYIVDDQGEMTRRVQELRSKYEAHPSSVASVHALREAVANSQSRCDLEEAYSLLQATTPEARIQVEPFLTVHALHSTPNATANATLDCIAAIRTADDRKVHGQVLLQGEFYDITGVAGVPLSLRRSEWRVGTYQPLTEIEVERLKSACESISRSYSDLWERKLS